MSADELDTGQHPFKGFTVEDPAGQTLGKLEGFILAIDAPRPYYVVVDGGGWFRSKHFLLPIGHVALDSESRRLVADVAKERVSRYPGFDLKQFQKLSDDDWYALEEQMMAACCPEEMIDRSGPAVERFEVWAHYRMPVWWDTGRSDSREVSDRTATRSQR